MSQNSEFFIGSDLDADFSIMSDLDPFFLKVGPNLDLYLSERSDPDPSKIHFFNKFANQAKTSKSA